MKLFSQGSTAMQGIPWIVYLVAPLVLGLMLWQRRKLSTAIAANTDKSFGAVAQRLGLAITEGDPSLNLLYFQQPARDFQRTLSAQGQPYGRPARFTLIDGQKTSNYLVARKITTSYGCFLEVETQARLPAFELSLREPNQYLVPNLEFAERKDLSAASCGDAELDRLFVIRAADPRVAPALIPALKVLSTQLAVHMAGEGQKLWISLPRFALPYFAQGPEEFMLALESAACGLEGRPAPARLGMPLPAAAAVSGA
jgi:hypothetical protein